MAKITCPVCGETIDEPKDGICPSCGIPLAASGTAAPSAPAASAPSVVGDGAKRTAVTLTNCPVCDAPIRPGAKVCEDCGVNILEAVAKLSAPAPAAAPDPTPAVQAAAVDAFCPSCGAPRRPGASFCRECGESFPTAPTVKDEGLLNRGELLAGRYRIDRKLGGGGMGAVFLAQDLNLKGKNVAVKAVLNSSDPELLKAARQEAENLMGIDHPNIVTLRDIVEKSGVPFIVMDYLEGPDWNDQYEERVRTKNEAFTAEEALQMMVSILPAFEYLHGRKPPVVYRDFKPGQVKTVTERGTGLERHVLLDLGVAYAYEGKPVEAWGTAGYAPPEIGGICLQPPAMDLATICRTLEGLLGIDLNEYPYGQMPEREKVPWIPEPLYNLLERGTALDPRRRFQHIGDLKAQLEGVLRLIQGQEGTLPRPSGSLHMPVVSRLFTGNLQRTTGAILALPVPPPEDPTAQMLDQANELLLQGKAGEALTQAETALTVNPGSTTARLIKTIALDQQGKTAQAEKELAYISSVVDTSTDWRYAMVAAQIAEKADNLDSAESFYRDLIRLVPGELPPRQKLANLLMTRKRYFEAADLYAQIVGADPANAEAVLQWADALAALGKQDQSIQVLQRVGENAVRYVDAQIKMIRLLLKRGNADPNALNAAAESLDIVRPRSQTPEFHRLLGDWWFETYQLARKGQLKAITRFPQLTQRPTVSDIAHQARDAYRHYLRVAPQSDDNEEVIGRIHFGIQHLM